MRTALAQMEVIPGQPEKTLDRMLDTAWEAMKQDAHLLAFPEMSFGYLVGDKWENDEYCKHLMSFNEALKDASAGVFRYSDGRVKTFGQTDDTLGRIAKTALAWGNIYLDEDLEARTGDTGWHPNKDGRTRRYNATYVFQRGQAVERAKESDILPPGVQPKTLLPTYRFFDDQRHFFSLEDVAKDFAGTLLDDLPAQVTKEVDGQRYVAMEDLSKLMRWPLEELTQPFLIDVDGEKEAVGIETCEDLWCADYRMDGEAINPTKMLIRNGAKRIINLSNSPWTYGKNGARDRRVRFLKQDVDAELGNGSFVPFYYVNCTGAQNNGKNIIVFDGGSTVYGTDGLPRVFAEGPYEEELMIIDDADLKGPAQQRVEKAGYARKLWAERTGQDTTALPPIRQENIRIAQKLDALVVGMRHMKHMVGAPGEPLVLNGMSGGLDSCLTSGIASIAYGPEKVCGVTMPWVYTSDDTLGHAQHCADALGIRLIAVPIHESATLKQRMIDDAARQLGVKTYDEQGQRGKVQRGNLAAKERMTVLSNLAALSGAIYLNNGNKLEAAIGYFTLDADGRGAIAPLSDVYKFEEFQMVRHMNEEIFGREAIPYALIPDERCRWGKGSTEPSAEIEEAQKDPMWWGHDDAVVDMVLDFKKKSLVDFARMYAEGTYHKRLAERFEMPESWGLEVMKTYGADKDPQKWLGHMEWLSSNMEGLSIAKRTQSQPGIDITKTAWGFDNRESIMPYERLVQYAPLRERVLAMKEYVPAVLAEVAA